MKILLLTVITFMLVNPPVFSKEEIKKADLPGSVHLEEVIEKLIHIDNKISLLISNPYESDIKAFKEINSSLDEIVEMEYKIVIDGKIKSEDREKAKFIKSYSGKIYKKILKLKNKLNQKDFRDAPSDIRIKETGNNSIKPVNKDSDISFSLNKSISSSAKARSAAVWIYNLTKK